MSPKIGVIQAGFGNSFTIANMLRVLEFQAEEVFYPTDLAKFSHIILPGVGNWSRGAELLSKRGWVEELHARRIAGDPILGVCLGMQLLGKSSDEGVGAGLGLLDFNVVSLSQSTQRKVNVGWKMLLPGEQGPEFQLIGPFYFTHSYCIQASGADFEKAYVDGSRQICAVVNEENIWGAQFHPERSNTVGMQFLKNFVLGTL